MSFASPKFDDQVIRNTVERAFVDAEMTTTYFTDQWDQMDLRQAWQKGYAIGLREGRREGYQVAVMLGLELRFGVNGLRLMSDIYKIDDPDILSTLCLVLRIVESPEALRSFYQQ